MIAPVLSIISVVFLLPNVDVRWVKRASETIDVAFVDGDSDVRECITGGLKTRTRYDIKVCRRRVGWLDSCSERRREVRTLRFDPIGETYKVEVDVQNDGVAPEITSEPSFEKAFQHISTIPSVALDSIAGEEEVLVDNSRAFVSVRVVRDCQGEYNATLARISRFITLGLLDIGRYDSGWLDFRLRDEG